MLIALILVVAVLAGAWLVARTVLVQRLTVPRCGGPRRARRGRGGGPGRGGGGGPGAARRRVQGAARGARPCPRLRHEAPGERRGQRPLPVLAGRQGRLRERAAPRDRGRRLREPGGPSTVASVLHPRCPLAVRRVSAELGLLGLVALLVLPLRRRGGRSPPARESARRDPAAGAALALLACGTASAAIDWTWELPAAFLLVVVAAACSAGPALTGAAASRRPPRRVRLGRRHARDGLGGDVVAAVVLVVARPSSPTAGRQSGGRPRGGGGRRRAARAVAPWSGAPRLQLALVTEREGDLDGARAEVAEAVERAPSDWRVWLVVAARRPVRATSRSRRGACAGPADLNPRSAIFGTPSGAPSARRQTLFRPRLPVSGGARPRRRGRGCRRRTSEATTGDAVPRGSGRLTAPGARPRQGLAATRGEILEGRAVGAACSRPRTWSRSWLAAVAAVVGRRGQRRPSGCRHAAALAAAGQAPRALRPRPRPDPSPHARTRPRRCSTGSRSPRRRSALDRDRAPRRDGSRSRALAMA